MRTLLLKRPVNKLYPLDIRNEDNLVIKDIRGNDDVISARSRANRPKQLAAEKGTLI